MVWERRSAADWPFEPLYVAKADSAWVAASLTSSVAETWSAGRWPVHPSGFDVGGGTTGSHAVQSRSRQDPVCYGSSCSIHY
jgi:hypothetical protein